MAIFNLHSASNLVVVELTLLWRRVRLTWVMVTKVALKVLLAYCVCPGNPGIAANHEVEALSATCIWPQAMGSTMTLVALVLLFVLLLVYVRATFKVISRWTPTSDSVHSR